MSLVLSHWFLWYAINVARYKRHTIFPILEVVWTFGFNGAQEPICRIGSVAIVESLWQREKKPPFVAIRTNVFESQYLMLNIVKAKSKVGLHIVGGVIFLLESFVCRSKGVMFVSSDFSIVQSFGIGLHRPTSFGRVGWQSCYLPIGRRTINA